MSVFRAVLDVFLWNSRLAHFFFFFLLFSCLSPVSRDDGSREWDWGDLSINGVSIKKMAIFLDYSCFGQHPRVVISAHPCDFLFFCSPGLI